MHFMQINDHNKYGICKHALYDCAKQIKDTQVLGNSIRWDKNLNMIYDHFQPSVPNNGDKLQIYTIYIAIALYRFLPWSIKNNQNTPYTHGIVNT